MRCETAKYDMAQTHTCAFNVPLVYFGKGYNENLQHATSALTARYFCEPCGFKATYTWAEHSMEYTVTGTNKAATVASAAGPATEMD